MRLRLKSICLKKYLGSPNMSVRENNQRIAKNTIVLYGRMVFVMMVSFFTTRIVLKVLGVEDFGLQNAVGGVAAMFSFINGSLSSACARYYSYELGRKRNDKLNNIFSLMLLLYVGFAIILIVLLETLGSWYVANKIVCDPGRIAAARLYFQFVVGMTVASWLSVPYSAMIIAYEDMTVYAYLSVFDVSIKLIAVIVLMFVTTSDMLVCYGKCFLVMTIVCSAVNIFVARMRYSVCKFRPYFQFGIFKELLKFNWWQMFGSFAWTTSEVFVNLLLNSFFGPVVNAARNVSLQLMVGVTAFTQNFLTATRPQIIKYWAADEKREFYLLIKRASKIAYFLVYIFALPLYAELETVFQWWLPETPAHAVAFTKIILLINLVNTFSFPLTTGAQAIGKLALFEGIGSGSRLLVWPISWVALRQGASPEVVFIVSLLVTILCVWLRLVILFRLARLSIRDYVIHVFGRLAIYSVVAAIPILVLSLQIEKGFLNFGVVGVASVVLTSFFFYVCALERSERIWVNALGKRILSRLGG